MVTENKKVRMKYETYGKEDLAKLVEEYNRYLEAPTGSKKERDKHNTEFEEAVKGASVDIRDFSTGLLSVENDAIADMREYINMFGKEYVKGKYVFTPEAQKALARLDSQEKAIQRKKTKAAAEKTTVRKKDKNKEEKAAGISQKEASALMKKKPHDRTLQEYLLLHESIENNPKLSPEQKNKAKEKLTSQARLRMTKPKEVKDEELAAVPAFIEAFGYDKGHAINKQARSFKNAMDKRQVSPVKISKLRPAENKKEEKKQKRGLFGWMKEKARNVGKWINRYRFMVVTGLVAGASLFGAKGSEPRQQDRSPDNDIAKEITLPEVVVTGHKIAKTIELPEIVVTPKEVDLSILKQYAKRVGFQDKLTEEESAQRAAKDFKAFRHLTEEFKEQFSGDSDEEKLARLGVVRGDQDKLRPAVDALINGEKVDTDVLREIAARTQQVTKDFGAGKDYAQQNGTQTLDMSTYMLQKAMDKSRT